MVWKSDGKTPATDHSRPGTIIMPGRMLPTSEVESQADRRIAAHDVIQPRVESATVGGNHGRIAIEQVADVEVRFQVILHEGVGAEQPPVPHAGHRVVIDIDARNPIVAQLAVPDEPAHGAELEGPLRIGRGRSEEHTSELQSRGHLVCRLPLETKKKTSSIAAYRQPWPASNGWIAMSHSGPE